MATKNSAASEAQERELVITRVYDAPRQLVWQAWTEPEHVAQWWGPEGFDTRVTELDLKPGGRWRYVMIDAAGAEYPSEGVFSEIVAPEKLVTTDEFGEDFEHPELADLDLPQGIVVTVLFEDLGEKTKLTIRIAHPTAEDRQKHEDMGVVAGWNSSLNKFEELLAKEMKGEG